MFFLKFTTFNIRGAWYADEQNALIHRIGMIFKKLDDENPDVVCFQEMTESIRDFFNAHFHGHTIIGTGREEGYTGEMMAIMINNATIEILGFDTFWLSDEPYTPGSRFDCQSEYPRICTVAFLKEKATGKVFRVYNVHLDIFEDAAYLGVQKVLARLSDDMKKSGMPFIMAGDFNVAPSSETIKLCYANTDPVMVDHTKKLTLTRHGFMNRGEMKKIDYIFTDENTAKTVSEPDVWDDKLDGIWLSDHFPISVTLSL